MRPYLLFILAEGRVPLKTFPIALHRQSGIVININCELEAFQIEFQNNIYIAYENETEM